METVPDLHLSEYWALIWKRRRVVILCVLAAFAVGAFKSFTTKPAYQAMVVLNVERKPSGLDMGEGERFQYDPQFLSTQTQLIKSRVISQKVVEKLKLYDNRELNPPGKDGRISSGPDAVVGIAEGIRGRIEVIPVRDTNILRLLYVGASPQLTAEIANALAEGYIDWSVETKYQVVGLTSDFLKGQIDQIKRELDEKQKELLAYGRQKDIVSDVRQENTPMRSLDSLNADYAAAVAARVASEAKYQEIRTAPPENIAETLSGMVSGLRAEQLRLERDYAEKLNLYKPEWPAMLQQKAQIDKGRQHLDGVIQETVVRARQSAKAEYETAVRREGSLRGVLNAQRSEVMASNVNAVEYNDLRLQVEAKRRQLDELLKQEAQTEMTSRLRGERMANARIVDRALTPWGRFKPSHPRNLALALFVGGALGVGLALFLAYMDRSLRSAEDVEKHLQLPSLGVIPALGSFGLRKTVYGLLRRKKTHSVPAEEQGPIELLPNRFSRSRIAESYRAFRAALLLSRAGGLKSIVVTSSFPREGKTSTSANLAVVLAQLGKRVLLVDADLHRPRLHEVFRESNRSGLVSMLAENVEPTKVIVKTDVPNVFLVPAGPSSPNPSALLASEAMVRFLELARMNFDYVVIDAPPVAPVADALLIGHECDGVVLCVQGGKTPREHIRRTRDKLLWANVRILGVLITNLSDEAAAYGKGYSYEDYYSGAVEPQVDRRVAAVAQTTV